MTGISVLLAMTLLMIVLAVVRWKIRPVGYSPIIGLALVVAAFKLQGFAPLNLNWLVQALGFGGLALTTAALTHRIWRAKRAAMLTRPASLATPAR